MNKGYYEKIKKHCIVCGKKKNFISRLLKFSSCQKCRDLYAAGFSVEEIRKKIWQCVIQKQN